MKLCYVFNDNFNETLNGKNGGHFYRRFGKELKTNDQRKVTRPQDSSQKEIHFVPCYQYLTIKPVEPLYDDIAGIWWAAIFVR